jgi:hypothetical protein
MKKTITILLALLIISAGIFEACRKPDDFFPELDKTEFSENFEGSFAAPLIDTEISLLKFIPEDESSNFWIEVDDQNLIHLRMTGENLATHPVSSIFPLYDYPLASGTEIQIDSFDVVAEMTDLEFNNEMFDGNVYLADPRITILLNNEIPIVTYYRLDTLEMRDSDDNPILHNEYTNYPISAPENMGETAEDSILIDKNRVPSLPDAFFPVPSYLKLHVTIGNPEVQTLPYELSGDEAISLTADIDIPTDLRIENLQVKDTMNFMDLSENEGIESVSLKIKFNNGLPLGAMTQIYIADSLQSGGAGTVIDSLFTDTENEEITNEGWLLESAQTDSEGIVTTGTENFLIVTLDKERLNKLQEQKASKLIVSTRINTYNSEAGSYVKLLSSYKLGLKIAVKLDFAIQNE